MDRPFSACTQPSRAIVCWPEAGTAHGNQRSEQQNAEACNVAGRRKHRHFMESFPGSTGHNEVVPAWSQGRSLLYHPASARTTMVQHYAVDRRLSEARRFVAGESVGDSFRVPRNPSRVDAKRRDHFPTYQNLRNHYAHIKSRCAHRRRRVLRRK